MSGRRSSQGRGNSFEARSEQRAAAEQKRLAILAAMRSRNQKQPESEPQSNRVQRNADQTLETIDNLRLYSVGDTTSPRRISPEYRELLGAAIEVMNSGGQMVLLSWPPHSVCMPAIAALLVLADVAGARQTRVNKGNEWVHIVAEKPLGLRAVVFPYSRSSHGPAREVQIDKQQFADIQIRHLSRGMENPDSNALKDYHTVLSRVRDLTGIGRDGQPYPEYEHPVLDEIVPHGSATNGCPDNGELLWRTKSKTDLRALGRTGHADKPTEAEFFIYHLHANESLPRELKAIGAEPDLILLDFGKSARGRLGRDWVSNARKALVAIRTSFPTSGILAVTDDPWSCDAARYDVLGKRIRQPNGSKKTEPAMSRALNWEHIGILGAASQKVIEWIGASHITADGFTANLNATIERLRTIARQLSDRGNPLASDEVREIITKIKRSVCLPGSLAEFSQFIEREHAEAAAADTMTSYRIDSNLSALNDLRRGATQVAAKELSFVKDKAHRLIRTSETATPMSTLLESSLASAMKSATHTVVVLRNELIADFTSDRLSQKFAELESNVKSDMVRFTTRQGLADLAGAPAPYRNLFGHALMVAPTRQSILEILSQPWLPEKVLFLADSDTLRFAARDASRLATLLSEPALKVRLNQFASAANQRVQQIGDHIIAFDSVIRPSEDIEFPLGTVVDLAGNQRADRRIVEIKLESGQRILARPGTGLVQRDNTRSVRCFIEIPANKISEGDEICVISTGFIEKARSLLNITATAAEEIRNYHATVLARFATLPGDTGAARLRELCQKMGAPAVSTATARYWIDLEEQQMKPLHEVVPHAPQDRLTFLRFTDALGISKQLANTFWAWAVIAQRSSRLKAGAAFHDAYKGILTDEHSAFAASKDRAGEIRKLRAIADEYVSTVTAIDIRGAS